MPSPPYQPVPSFSSRSCLSSPPQNSSVQYSQFQTSYSMSSVPRGMTESGDYDIYEAFQSSYGFPQHESYNSDPSMNHVYTGGNNFAYTSGGQSGSADDFWLTQSSTIEESSHSRPLINHPSESQFMRPSSSHLQMSSWTNSVPSASYQAPTSVPAYSSNYPSPPGSSSSFNSYAPLGASDGRRSRSSDFPSPYTNPSRLSPPQTPNLRQLTVARDEMMNFDGYREQMRLFKEALLLPLSFNAGPFVPQKIYIPHTNSDRRRYVEEIELQGPIYFWMEGPDECGIPLIDALHSRVRRLRQRDEPVFEGRGPSISVRIQWPGYRPWSRQIPTKDFRSPPQPITKAKLAKNIAKCVERFLSARTGTPLEDDVDPRWKVGPRAHEIKLEDIYLVSMHHVSMGSWQPQLRLRRPLS